MELLELLELYCELLIARFGLLDLPYVLPLFFLHIIGLLTNARPGQKTQIRVSVKG